MAATTTSTMDNVLLASALAPQIEEYAREYAFLPGLCKYIDMRGKQSKSVGVPKWNAVPAASSLTEGTDLDSTAVTDTNVSLSVGEVGVRVDVTDLSSRTSITTLDDYARLCAESVAERIETDITALFTAFSQSAGATTTELSLDTLITAMRMLDDAKARGRRVCILAPRQIEAMRRLFAGTTGSTATFHVQNSPDLALKDNPLKFSWLGCDFYQSVHVPKINTNADYSGAMFIAERALGYAELAEIGVEIERNASLRATEVVCTTTYGVGEIHDTFGVQIVSKVAA